MEDYVINILFFFQDINESMNLEKKKCLVITKILLP